jgi:hypothetical protein
VRDEHGRAYMPTPLGPFYGVDKWVPSVDGVLEGAMFGVDRSYRPGPNGGRCSAGETCEHYTWQDPRPDGCQDAAAGGKACS